jgi:hypothetical protein
MIPASIRNNNPGAQEPGPSSRKFGATSHEVLRWTYKGKPATNKIATFPTSEHGAAAMFDLLHRSYTGLTIEKAISRWCGGYYASSYVGALRAANVTATDLLTKDLVKDPGFAIPLCQAMARVEAGARYPLDDAGWEAAHRMAFGGSVAPEFHPDNDVPSPGPRARMVATAKDAAPKVIGGSVATSAATYVATYGIPAPTAPVTTSIQNVGAWKGILSTATADPLMAVGLGIVAAALGWFAWDKWRG